MTLDRSNPGPAVAEHHARGTGTTRVPYPIGVRRVRVAARTLVTPRMMRLTLTGPGLDGFHSHQADDHVRIVFPDPDGTQRDPVPNTRHMLDWPHPFPRTRKYTVRRYDAASRELDLDFVLHGEGLASVWVGTAEVGDEVTVAGPPGAVAFPQHYDHYVFAVDTTALPAAARWLEESRPDVSAHLVIVTDHEEEQSYPLAVRDDVQVTWLRRDHGGSPLAETVDGLRLPPGRTFLFAAGEATDIKPLRRWRRDRVDRLVTGYWKRGVDGLEED